MIDVILTHYELSLVFFFVFFTNLYSSFSSVFLSNRLVSVVIQPYTKSKCMYKD